MKRTKWNPRKVLIASAGVASVNYALSAGCGSGERTEITVANLLPCPPSQCPGDGIGGALVANLVAMPPGGSFNGGNGGFAGASVANLVAPPPGGAPGTPELPDASTPAPPDSGPSDAAPDGAP